MRLTGATALIALALTTTSTHGAEPAAPAASAAAAGSPATAASPRTGCLPSGNGFLRARIRGALNLDINWHNAELECEGAARPNGTGIRLSFAGPIHSDGRRLRMVFGIADAAEGNAGSALPTNLTVIFEGEKRLFSTRGEDRCTVDKLNQERVGALGGPARSYRVIARGFCIEPVSALNADERIVVSSFDFAGHVIFSNPAAKPQPPNAGSSAP
jgi:hypothetical protein